MKLTGEYLFEASPQEVWDALFDPEVLAAALPGCEKLELVDGFFLGDLNVKVGPISGKFTGKVELKDEVPPVSYRMIVDGKGPHGFVKANATIELQAEGDSTRMRYDADSQVGGKIATVGQRLIETSAKAITRQSLEGLHENIKIRAAAHRAAVAAQQPVAAAAPEPVAAAAPEPVAAAAPEPLAAEPAVAVADAKPAIAASVAKVAAAGAAQVAVTAAPTIKPSYKRADATKLAGTVTKEVMRVMLPWILVGLLSIALLISILTR